MKNNVDITMWQLLHSIPEQQRNECLIGMIDTLKQKLNLIPQIPQTNLVDINFIREQIKGDPGEKPLVDILDELVQIREEINELGELFEEAENMLFEGRVFKNNLDALEFLVNLDLFNTIRELPDTTKTILLLNVVWLLSSFYSLEQIEKDLNLSFEQITENFLPRIITREVAQKLLNLDSIDKTTLVTVLESLYPTILQKPKEYNYFGIREGKHHSYPYGWIEKLKKEQKHSTITTLSQQMPNKPLFIEQLLILLKPIDELPANIAKDFLFAIQTHLLINKGELIPSYLEMSNEFLLTFQPLRNFLLKLSEKDKIFVAEFIDYILNELKGEKNKPFNESFLAQLEKRAEIRLEIQQVKGKDVFWETAQRGLRKLQAKSNSSILFQLFILGFVFFIFIIVMSFLT